jgi:hypothetical protein
VPDRHPHGAFDQGRHGDAAPGVTNDHFLKAIRDSCATRRGDRHRDRATMKTPVALVTAALTAAILLAASLLTVTGTRGENAREPQLSSPAKAGDPVFQRRQ